MINEASSTICATIMSHIDSTHTLRERRAGTLEKERKKHKEEEKEKWTGMGRDINSGRGRKTTKTERPQIVRKKERDRESISVHLWWVLLDKTSSMVLSAEVESSSVCIIDLYQLESHWDKRALRLSVTPPASLCLCVNTGPVESVSVTETCWFTPLPVRAGLRRSEERRVGKECRSRWSPHH